MGDIGVYDGADWRIIYPFPEIPATGADVQIAPTAPTPRGVGDMWIDSDDTLLNWDAAWISLTLQNGWVNYGSGYAPARYRKLMNGMVVIEGLVTSGSSTTIATMPVGYRPPYHCLMYTTVNGNTFSRLDVNSSGTVVASNWTAGWASIHCTYYVG